MISGGTGPERLAGRTSPGRFAQTASGACFDLSVYVDSKATKVESSTRVIGETRPRSVEGYLVTHTVVVANDPNSTVTSPELHYGGLKLEARYGSNGLVSGTHCASGHPYGRLYKDLHGTDISLDCLVPSLRPGQKETYEVGSFVPGNKVAALTARVRCQSLESTCANNYDTFTYDVQHPTSRIEEVRLTPEGGFKMSAADVDGTNAVRGQARGGPLHFIPVHSESNWVAAVQFAFLEDSGGARLASAGAGRARLASASCAWVADPNGRLKRTRSNHGFCDKPIWLDAQLSGLHQESGTATFQLSGPLPAGGYTIITRAIDRFGLANTGFTASQHNRIHVRCVARLGCR